MSTKLTHRAPERRHSCRRGSQPPPTRRTALPQPAAAVAPLSNRPRFLQPPDSGRATLPRSLGSTRQSLARPEARPTGAGVWRASADWQSARRRIGNLRYGLRAALALLFCVLAGPAFAQYAIAPAVNGAGGGAASGGTYTVTDTVGQPAIGLASGGAYSFSGGFWPDYGGTPVPATLDLGVQAGQTAALPLAKLLARASDPNGETLHVASVSAVSAQGGTVVLGGSAISYTPAGGFTGSDTFTYIIADTGGDAATGTVTVTVTASTAVSLNVMYLQKEGGEFVVRFAGTPDTAYTIETTTSLVEPITWSWKANRTAPGTVTPGDFGVGVFEFRESTGGAEARYYRTVYPAYSGPP